MDYYNFKIFIKERIIKKKQYGKYQHYVFLQAVKEFCNSLCDCYQDEVDEPLHMLLAYLNKLNISMKESTKIINETIDFCKRNSKAIDKKDVSLFEMWR